MDEWRKQLRFNLAKEAWNFFANRVCKRNSKKEYCEYLAKWKNRGSKDTSWVSKWNILARFFLYYKTYYCILIVENLMKTQIN